MTHFIFVRVATYVTEVLGLTTGSTPGLFGFLRGVEANIVSENKALSVYNTLKNNS